jgi:hypothetical protein
MPLHTLGDSMPSACKCHQEEIGLLASGPPLAHSSPQARSTPEIAQVEPTTRVDAITLACVSHAEPILHLLDVFESLAPCLFRLLRVVSLLSQLRARLVRRCIACAAG